MTTLKQAVATQEFAVHPYVQFMEDAYNPYRKWLADEGLPIIDGEYVHDVKTMELGDWPRRRGRGAYLVFADQRVADACVLEIPRGGSITPQHQLFEEIAMVVSGQGTTSIWWDDNGPRRTFEWQRGSLFALPLNARYEHSNTSADEPARLVSLTSQPVVFELYRDPKFIFGTEYQFRDRFDPDDPDFFTRPGKYLTDYYGGILNTNFISDVRQIELVPRERRGKGNRNMYIHLAGSTMFAHVSQFPVGTYKKAHRHGPGAHVCMIDSTGYTLMWQDREEPKRYDWAEGSIICPAAGQWHQHYNTGTEPCRFVALHASTAVQREEKGIEQIEFHDEDDRMRQMYVEECRKNGVTVQM